MTHGHLVRTVNTSPAACAKVDPNRPHVSQGPEGEESSCKSMIGGENYPRVDPNWPPPAWTPVRVARGIRQ
jgi:hypothetical protein